MSPIIIGLVAGVACCFAVGLKTKFGYDDALDVVGVHFVGGLVGSLLVGFFADATFFGGDEPFFMDGIFFGGGAELLIEQIIANGVTIVYAFTVTTLIMLALKATMGVRVPEELEAIGLDASEHAETAYHSDASAGRTLVGGA
jgi:Amt family ammonium transporter